jgi:hypothetical protein
MGEVARQNNSLVDARLMIDLNENYLASQQLAVSKKAVIVPYHSAGRS